ncbi:hypothetical protein A2U01_0087623, partial [Trifolium medium]|nr:hypothetical protein [Trifolium medium]
LKNRACSPSEPTSEPAKCLPLSLAEARNFWFPVACCSLKPGTFRFLMVSVAFTRCSEELSDVPSLSFAFSRPATVSGFVNF